MTDCDRDLYELLQVSPTADPDVIAAAWRRLAARAHPDAGGDPGRFQELEHAYATLSDPAKRAAYDLDRRRAAEASAGADSTMTIAAPAPATPVPFTDPAGPVAAAPGIGGGHGWWTTWRRLEGRMAHALTAAPWGVSVLTTAVSGGAIGYVGSGLATLPPPAEIWQLGIVGLLAWLSAGCGFLLGRGRSITAWTWAVRAYVAAILLFAVLATFHALAPLLGPAIIVAVAVLTVRHRSRRTRTVGAPR